MKALAVLTCALLAVSAHAQTTWKGLNFGQNRESVRAALAAQNFDVEVSQEGSLQSVSDYQLLLPGMRNPFPLKADFHFTDAGGLMNITLSLDLAAMRQNFSYVGNDEAMLLFAATRLQRALTDRYFAPLDAANDCATDAATTAKRPLACDIHWHAPTSSVELNWTTRSPRLYIRYQMLAPDL
jgi:hypothetical protein